MKKITIFCCIALTSLFFTACAGKNTDYTGYYIFDSGKSASQSNFAMQVDKDGTVICMQSSNKDRGDYLWARSHKGIIENGSGEGLIYFSQGADMERDNSILRSEFARYSPVKLALADDGKRAFLWAESDDFYAVTFDVVDEDKYNDFVDIDSVNEDKLFIKWDGAEFQTRDFWSQSSTAMDYSPITVEEAATPVEAAVPVEEAAPADEPAKAVTVEEAAPDADDFGW